MTKYTKLLGCFFLVLITFSLYSARIVLAHQDKSLEIATLEGEAASIEPLYLSGYASSSLYDLDSTFTYQNNEFTYMQDMSLLEKIDYAHDPLVNKLLNENRSFLRGKAPYDSTFKETENQIIYAASVRSTDWSTDSNDFNVSTLNKSTNEEKNYTLSPPEELTTARYIEVSDIYISYPNVYFTVFGIFDQEMDASGNSQVLSVNLEDQNPQLKTVRELPRELNEYNSPMYYQPANNSSGYYIMGEYSNPESSLGAVFLYSYETDELIELSSEELSDFLMFADGETVYVLNPTSEGYDVYTLNKEDNSLSMTTSIETLSIGDTNHPDFYGGQILPFTVSDGNLYFHESAVTENGERIAIQVNDVQSGELLYHGVVQPTENQDNQMDIYAHELAIQE